MASCFGRVRRHRREHCFGHHPTIVVLRREARDRFRGQIGGPDVERLLLSEQGRQAGFILTGVDVLPEALVAATSHVRTDPLAGLEREPLLEGMPTPKLPNYLDLSDESSESEAFEQGLEALREERAARAVDRFVEAVRHNPYHREAYLALLAVLDGAGRYDEAELYGALAARYLDSDGLVRYRQGINFVRQGRFADAVAAFDHACELAPDLYPPAYFAAHVLIAQGMDLPGAVARLERAHRTAPDEVHIAESLRIGRAWLRVRRVARLFAAALGLGALAAVGVGVASAWLGLGLALLTAVSARPVTALAARRQAQKDVAPSSVA